MCVLILAFSYFYVWTSVKVGYSYLLCSVLISGSIWPVKFRLFCVQHFSSLLQLQQLSIRSPIKFGNLWSILSSKVRSIRSISMQQFVWVDLTQTPFFPVLSVLLLFAFFCRFLSVLIFLCLYLWVCVLCNDSTSIPQTIITYHRVSHQAAMCSYPRALFIYFHKLAILCVFFRRFSSSISIPVCINAYPFFI